MSRVLMVDNAELFRMLDASFLRRAGWDIDAARDPVGVTVRARARRPDVVLLDSAHGFDAPACLRLLKADADLRAIPVLALAAPAEAAACESAGAEATLTRPVVAAALEAALCALAHVASRAGRRRPSRLPARVATPSGALRGRLRDISASGAFLALSPPPPTGTPLEIHLRLPLPDGPHPVDARAVVVREVPEDPATSRVAGIGVRFTGVRGTDATLIDRYVNLTVDGEAAGEEDETT